VTHRIFGGALCTRVQLQPSALSDAGPGQDLPEDPGKAEGYETFFGVSCYLREEVPGVNDCSSLLSSSSPGLGPTHNSFGVGMICTVSLEET
jgi:hypothetical protein